MHIHKNNKPINVTFILFSLKGGGAERNILNFIKYHDPKKVTPSIITIKNTNDYASYYKRIPITHYPLFDGGKIPLYLWPWKGMIALFKMYLLIKRLHIDVIVGAAEHLPFYYTIILSKLLTRKSILIVGNNIVMEEKLRPLIHRKINYFLFSLCFRNADSIISVSKGLKDNIDNHFNIDRRKNRVVYNGVDVKKISNLARSSLPLKYKKIFTNHFVLITMCRLEMKKGLDILIRSMPEIKKLVPNVKLILIGKGSSRDQLQNIVTQLKLQDTVHFLDFVAGNPYVLLKNANLFLFTSRYEGFGNTIVEALASGVPVVSIDCNYGPREILNDSTIYRNKTPGNSHYAKYGILIPASSINEKNPHVLSKLLITIIRKRRLRDKYKDIINKRAEKFHIKKMVDTYEFIITHLV